MAVAQIQPAPGGPADNILIVFRPPSGQGDALTLPCPGDLLFSSTIPGGHDTLSLTVGLASDQMIPPCLAPMALVDVVDRRSGDIVWHGRISDPGQSDTTVQGISYSITANGEQDLLDGWREAYNLVDRDLTHWIADDLFPAGQQTTGDGAGFANNFVEWIPDSPDADLRATIGDGTSVPTSSVQRWIYYPQAQCEAYGIAGIMFSTISNATSTAHSQHSYVGTTLAGLVQTTTQTISTTQTDLYVHAGVGSWSNGVMKYILIREQYTAANKTQSGNLQIRWGNIAVLGQRFNADGSQYSYQAFAPSMGVFDVMNDLFGRGLRLVVEDFPSRYLPTQFVDNACFYEGVSAREVLEFCRGYAPEMWWAVYEQGVSGRPILKIRNWNTQPLRYILHPDQGDLSLSGGADGLANRCLVIYQTTNGVVASTVVTNSVPTLTAAGLTKTMTVDLRDKGPIKLSVAQTLGTAALNLTDVDKTSGTVQVRGPIFDHVWGRMVQPWQIEPGWPIQIGTGPQDYLNANVSAKYNLPNDTDVFRCTAVSYEAASNTATLTVDGGGRTLVSRLRPEISRTVNTPKAGRVTWR